MKGNQEEKKKSKGSPNSPEKPVDGEYPRKVAFALSPWEKFVVFAKRRVHLVLALSFIIITIVVVRIFYRSQLEIVLLLLLALALVGLIWLESLIRKRSEMPEPSGDTPSPEVPHRHPADPEMNEPTRERSLVSTLAMELQKLNSDLESFKREVNRRFDKLEDRRPREGQKPFDEPPARNPPRSPVSPDKSVQEKHSSSVNLQTLERAVFRFLEEERGSCEIDRLLNTIQLWTGSDVSVEVQHLVPYSSGEWRLVALWPQRSQEGLALVSSGELVDVDVARYFDGSFGSRIIACRQPARISRNGNEVSVLRKGKVESS